MSEPVQSFGVSLICLMSPMLLSYWMVVFAAFALSNGSGKMSWTVWTLCVPANRACMLYKSMSGPLSIQSWMPWSLMHAWGMPPILMMLMAAASHPDLISAVPWTNSAFSSMYSSPQLMTKAPSPTENATRSMVATSGVSPFRDVNNPIGHALF